MMFYESVNTGIYMRHSQDSVILKQEWSSFLYLGPPMDLNESPYYKWMTITD